MNEIMVSTGMASRTSTGKIRTLFCIRKDFLGGVA